MNFFPGRSYGKELSPVSGRIEAFERNGPRVEKDSSNVGRNGRSRRGASLSNVRGRSHEKMGLRLAPLLHVQDRNMLGHERSSLGSRSE